MRSLPPFCERFGRFLIFGLVLIVVFLLDDTVDSARSSAANLAIVQRLPAQRSAAGIEASAASESLLYSFKSDVNYPKVVDGAEPTAGLVADASGALYGTTSIGGLESSVSGDLGNGTVFRLTLSGGQYHETIIHLFNPSVDGYDPNGSLIIDKTGALYGTASGGGRKACPTVPDATCGIVFKLTPSGTGYVEKTLYDFPGGSSGGLPGAGLTAYNGALYGTATSGGIACTVRGVYPVATGCGVVFKLTPFGSGYTETVIHSFGGATDGYFPSGPLTFDKSGAIHGTTQFGGSGSCKLGPFVLGCGTVFTLKPSGSGYVETRFSFPTLAAGFQPNYGVIEDATGAVYGTAQAGGASGFGDVFKLTLSGSTYTEHVLYSFKSFAKGDGASPQGLYAASNGALYGTASSGGTGIANQGQGGAIFELVPSGTAYAEHNVYFFKNTATSQDGAGPVGSLIADKSGSLYGMTEFGGAYARSSNCTIYGSCGGAVFKITL